MLKEVQEKASDATEKLGRLYDELSNRAKQGGSEVREALGALEPAVDKLRDRLAKIGSDTVSTAQETELQAHLGIMEARDRWEALSGDLQETAHWIEARGKAGRQALDHGRIQAHLARLDTDEEIERRKEEAHKIVAKGRQAVRREAISTLDGLIGALDKLRAKVDGDA